ncbi:MAG TPA: hypothetical protein V6D03_06785 [Candidatus Caenarcaniphilales bacterium]
MGGGTLERLSLGGDRTTTVSLWLRGGEQIGGGSAPDRAEINEVSA